MRLPIFLGDDMKQGIVLLVMFLGLCGGLKYYQAKAETEALKADNYRRNNAALLNQLRRVYEEKIRLQRENGILENAAKEETEVFDWYRDISGTAVIKCLQGRGNCQSTARKRADNLH
jgi:hypothetical protein